APTLFPYTTLFRSFTVTQEREDAPRHCLAHSARGEAGGERQPVPQRARGHIHARHSSVRHVAVETAAVDAELVQTLPGKEASQRECGVQTRSAMAFAHDKAVATTPIGFVRAHAQN